jgi:membrane protease YdiL (CAAX protease family)
VPLVPWRTRLPWWEYAAWLLGLTAVAFGGLFVLGPVGGKLQAALFGWLPAWLRGEAVVGAAPASAAALRATQVANLVIDGLANPVVEELYFRGYLLPRLAALGRAAPLANAALFALGHFWQPWNVPLIFAIVAVEAYAVRWRRSVAISILAHCAGNTIGAILALAG